MTARPPRMQLVKVVEGQVRSEAELLHGPCVNRRVRLLSRHQVAREQRNPRRDLRPHRMSYEPLREPGDREHHRHRTA
jgi:hypothetical protein